MAELVPTKEQNTPPNKAVKNWFKIIGIILGSIVVIYAMLFIYSWADGVCPSGVQNDQYGQRLESQYGKQSLYTNFVCAPIIKYLELKYCSGSCKYSPPVIKLPEGWPGEL